MAKPIEIGLVLAGDDARRFHKYMENPKITKEGRELIREAIKIAKKENLYTWILLFSIPKLSYFDLVFQSLDESSDVSGFFSTEQELDDFLKEDALNNQMNRLSATFPPTGMRTWPGISRWSMTAL